MKEQKKAMNRIREFNRFYMPKMGLLNNHYLGSQYSPTEARTLFEIYENDGCNAAHIAKTMNIDKSYLSKIIRNHEKKGYLTRTVSTKDSRSYHIHLTETGMKLVKEFIEKSNQQIAEIISVLSKEEYISLIQALNTVTDILKKCKEPKKSN